MRFLVIFSCVGMNARFLAGGWGILAYGMEEMGNGISVTYSIRVEWLNVFLSEAEFRLALTTIKNNCN